MRLCGSHNDDSSVSKNFGGEISGNWKSSLKVTSPRVPQHRGFFFPSCLPTLYSTRPLPATTRPKPQPVRPRGQRASFASPRRNSSANSIGPKNSASGSPWTPRPRSPLSSTGTPTPSLISSMNPAVTAGPWNGSPSNFLRHAPALLAPQIGAHETLLRISICPAGSETGTFVGPESQGSTQSAARVRPPSVGLHSPPGKIPTSQPGPRGTHAAAANDALASTAGGEPARSCHRSTPSYLDLT